MPKRWPEAGYEVTWLDVDSDGLIDLDDLERVIREDTAIVSLMWANNETGTVFPIAEAAEICRSKGTMFHTDAVQAVGKIDIDLRRIPINFLSLSGHKLHAPKGIAALYVNRKTRFNPYLLGGGQENKRRGGTENTASIVALERPPNSLRRRLWRRTAVSKRYATASNKDSSTRYPLFRSTDTERTDSRTPPISPLKG